MSQTKPQGFQKTERIEAPMGGPGRGPMGGGMVGQKAMDFGPSAKRLVARMRPDRGKAVLVVLLGVASVALMSVGPRILGHATDLVFNGFIGAKIPPGTPESRWPEAIQGMDVVPGQGVDFTAVAHVLLLVLAIYAAASLLGWRVGDVRTADVDRALFAVERHLLDAPDDVAALTLKERLDDQQQCRRSFDEGEHALANGDRAAATDAFWHVGPRCALRSFAQARLKQLGERPD